MWDAVPIWFLYASVLIVGHCADLVSVCFGVGCETLCRGGCSGTVMRFSTCGARLRGYSCFRLPHFGSVLNCQYRSIQVQVSIFQLSTIAALYKKRPRGVQRGAALCPFAVFSHSNVIYPLRASAVHVAYSREPQSMRLYDRSSAIHAAYTAGVPQSMRPFGRGLRSTCGYYFPIQNLENISLTRSSPSDSPRIRPRLSYASVRSME